MSDAEGDGFRKKSSMMLVRCGIETEMNKLNVLNVNKMNVYS